ncbi:hypothetical protein AAG906_005214 [Vitis piasezkii]
MEPHEKERETKRTKKTKSVRIFGHDLEEKRRWKEERVETMVVDPRGGKYSMGLKKWVSLSKVVLCFALNVKRQVQ